MPGGLFGGVREDDDGEEERAGEGGELRPELGSSMLIFVYIWSF